MRNCIRLLALVAAVGAVVAGPADSALAADDSAAFGQHVAACAEEHLGQRADVPAVTCTMPASCAVQATAGSSPATVTAWTRVATSPRRAMCRNASRTSPARAVAATA